MGISTHLVPTHLFGQVRTEPAREERANLADRMSTGSATRHSVPRQRCLNWRPVISPAARGWPRDRVEDYKAAAPFCIPKVESALGELERLASDEAQVQDGGRQRRRRLVRSRKLEEMFRNVRRRNIGARKLLSGRAQSSERRPHTVLDGHASALRRCG